jgi:hypothetical protein
MLFVIELVSFCQNLVEKPGFETCEKISDP